MYPPLFILITTVNGAGALIFPPRRIEARVGAFTEYLTSSVLHASLSVTGVGCTNNFLKRFRVPQYLSVAYSPKGTSSELSAIAIIHRGLAPLRHVSTGSQ